MKITIFNKLRKFEHNLYTADRLNFTRSLTMPQVSELTEIGKELGLEYKHKGCPKCLLNFLKKLAVPYFEQKQKLEDKKKEKENENKG